MGDSSGDVGEEPVMQVRRQKIWRMRRMSYNVGEATEGFVNEKSLLLQPLPSLHLRHRSFYNPTVASPTPHLILQPSRCIIYVTAHSSTILSLHLRHLASRPCQYHVGPNYQSIPRVIGIPGPLIWSKTLMELIFNPCGKFQ